MLRTSVVLMILKAGFRMNVIPSEAEATIDVRALPDEDMTTFYQEMEKSHRRSGGHDRTNYRRCAPGRTGVAPGD